MRTFFVRMFISPLLAVGLTTSYAQTAAAPSPANIPPNTRSPQISLVNQGFQPNNVLGLWLATDPIYRTNYPTKAVPLALSCTSATTTTGVVTIPRGAYFRQATNSEPDSDGSMVINLYEVPDDPSKPEADLRSSFFGAPLRLCLSGPNSITQEHYERRGGLSTGVLVVPFKIRSNGDLFGDGMIGPYLAYQVAKVSVLASAGISQISTVELGGDTIKNESGFTLALGFRFAVKKNWDVAFIIGADHLSGRVGKAWRYQDKPWASIAIGVNLDK